MGSFARILLWVCLAMFLGICSGFPESEVYSLSAFKEAIYKDPISALSSWNLIDDNPCNWSCICCTNARDHVIKLNVSGSSLKGFITRTESTWQQFYWCNSQRNWHVEIPKGVGFGDEPAIWTYSWKFWLVLLKLTLQFNRLTGSLPVEIGNLKYLQELRLDRNKLQGMLPRSNGSQVESNTNGMSISNRNSTGLCRMPQLRVADFSFNFFAGSVPKFLDYLPSASFQGNCFLNLGRDPRNLPTPLCDTCLCKNESSIIIPWKKSAARDNNISTSIDTVMLKDVLRYSREELEVACEDFSNIIGSSPDSIVYKGIIKGGPEIAIISLCIKEEHWTGHLELYYQKEVADLARLDHVIVGKLLGYCRESSPFTRMLVFRYASNGTLYEHLHCEERCQLSWTTHMNIVIGIAKALKYLHTEIDPPLTISELNSSSVYLTDDFSPKLVDFESWKTIISRSEKSSGAHSTEGAVCVLSSSVVGRHLDVQGNIFAFGLILLEIISGGPPYCKDRGCLLDWAKDYLELLEEMSNVVDPNLKHFRLDDLQVICEGVILCIKPKPSIQLTIQDFCTMLLTRIDTSVSSEIKASPLAWAEKALSSCDQAEVHYSLW